MTHDPGTLRTWFDLGVALRDLHAFATLKAPYDRIGVALPVKQVHQFRTVVIVSRNDAVSPGGQYSASGSVSQWVCAHNQAFIARNLEDLARFPTSRETMIRRGMNSICALPIAGFQGVSRALFVLGAERDRFNSLHVPHLARIGAVLGAVIQGQAAVREFLDSAATPESLTASSEPRLPTLDDVQRRYIRVVLDETRGVIEGKNGAAAILGVAPSTLRHKLDKLEIHRTQSASTKSTAHGESR